MKKCKECGHLIRSKNKFLLGDRVSIKENGDTGVIDTVYGDNTYNIDLDKAEYHVDAKDIELIRRAI